jgi:hypothetical protein
MKETTSRDAARCGEMRQGVARCVEVRQEAETEESIRHTTTVETQQPADIAWVVLNGDAIPLSNVTLIDIESDPLGRDLVTVQFMGSTHQSLVYLRQDRDAKMPLPAPQTPPDAS